MPTHFPDPDSARLTIGELARAAAVHVETIRFYQRRCLLAQPLRPLGGIRRYGRSDLDRLTFIKSAQRLGFSLEEVRGLLRLDDGAHCREARTLGAAKLALVRGRLADLRRLEHVLRNLVRRCGQSRGRLSCPLIAALHRPTLQARRSPGELRSKCRLEI